LKLNSIDDQCPPAVDTYVTPATPVPQSGTFGAIEPAMSHVMSDFTIPLSEYKWNQVVELQLPDGKKVLVQNEKENNSISYISR
jgi:hypothetical protein